MSEHTGHSGHEMHGDHDMSGGHGMQGGHDDMPDLHGMLIVGEDTTYLSHLPMFNHEHHDIQAVIEVAFIGDGDPHTMYINDRASSGERLYTFKPAELFVLPDLVADEPKREIAGTIFRGHFERGGVPIAHNVTARAENIVHFRQFSPIQYILFGAGDELFLAHWISKPPDFDQVLPVRSIDSRPSDEELASGVLLSFPDRSNDMDSRLVAGDTATGMIHGSGHHMVTVEVGAEIYFEEGELRVPAVFRQTEAEIAAGF